MGKIFKFKTEKQLNLFDKKYNYSGCLGEDVWIYGENTDRWFSIQYCGNRWLMNIHRSDHTFKHVDFYPITYDNFISFIESQLT